MLYYIVFIYIVLYCRFCFICVFTFYFMCEWQKYVPNSRKHGPRIPLFLTRRGFAIPAGIFPQRRHLPFFTPPPEQNAKAHQHGLRRHRLYECQRSPCQFMTQHCCCSGVFSAPHMINPLQRLVLVGSVCLLLLAAVLHRNVALCQSKWNGSTPGNSCQKEVCMFTPEQH